VIAVYAIALVGAVALEAWQSGPNLSLAFAALAAAILTVLIFGNFALFRWLTKRPE